MPENTDYMILGYALSAIMFGGLMLSIWWRYRALEKTETLLEQLENE